MNASFIADRQTVRDLEEKLFTCWPAVKTVCLDGWIVRLSDGHSRRANSASPLYSSQLPSDTLIDAVESLFAQAGLPPVFRITPLADPAVTSALELRGYATQDVSWGLAASNLRAGQADPLVTIAGSPDRAWIDDAMMAYGHGVKGAQALERMMAHLAVPAAFARLSEDGVPLAWGLAARDRQHIGLSDIVVHPQARGRGLGRRLVRALLAWGERQGATAAFLQTRDDNTAARTLYASLGFAPAYTYVHYGRAADATAAPPTISPHAAANPHDGAA